MKNFFGKTFFPSILFLNIIFLNIFFLPQAARATDYNLYVAAGPLLSVGAVRFGVKDWEFGPLNSGGVGFAKIFHDGKVYSGFGFVVVHTNSIDITQGVYGSVGFESLPIWIFTLRGELSMTASFNGVSRGDALLGINVRF